MASPGGHWMQLRRIAPAFEGCDVVWVSCNAGYAPEVAPQPLRVVPDASRWDKIGLVKMLLKVAWIVLSVRPHAIVTTGAAPGYFAIRIGKLIGARTMWIDSIANVEELSMSGRMAGKHATRWLTQWEHLAEGTAPAYHGAVVTKKDGAPAEGAA